MNFDPKSTITPIQILPLICNNTNCFYKIIIAKLLAFNVLPIALYTSKNFNNIYILKYKTIDTPKIDNILKIYFDVSTKL